MPSLPECFLEALLCSTKAELRRWRGPTRTVHQQLGRSNLQHLLFPIDESPHAEWNPDWHRCPQQPKIPPADAAVSPVLQQQQNRKSLSPVAVDQRKQT